MNSGFQSHDFTRRRSGPYSCPPPHFRRRISSESVASSTVDTKAHIPGINKRKSDGGYSAEDRYYDDSAFKRRMTSRDDEDDDEEIESREPSSPPPPSLQVPVRQQHDPNREVKRVGSSELASAMALASLAYGNSTHRQGHRTRNVYSAQQQQIFLGNSALPPNTKTVLEHLNNNVHHQNQMYRFGYNFPPQGYFAGLTNANSNQEATQQLQGSDKKQWVCDYCNNASFATYEEAFKHEKACQFNTAMICRDARDEGSVTNTSYQEGSTRETPDMDRACIQNLPEQIRSGNSAVYYAGEIPLAVTATDCDWLSETNCFVRSKCVEAFSAKEGDIMVSSKRGRISLYQVGIRCKFCADVDARERSSGAVSFPVSVSGIYESVKRWKSVHLPECKHIPNEVKEKIKSMEKSACVPTTRQYWIDSAKALGIDDTPDGLRFVIDPSKFDQDSAQSSMTKTRFAPSSAKRAASKDGGPKKEEYIVYPEDKSTITPYVYCLMRQVQPCVFTEADRFLSRSKSTVGFAGFECRHCNGHAGLGRYFPSTPKALSTNSTSQNIYSHIQKCRKCPQEVKDELKSLKFEKPTWLRRTCGWRQTFFEKLWERLHG